MTRKKKDLCEVKIKPVDNAYELLGQICRIIKEDPTRYNQEMWAEIRPDLRDDLNEELKRYLQMGWNREYARRKPACGTVGCVAGWTALMTLPVKMVPQVDTSAHAAKVLGLTNNQAAELFDGDAAGEAYEQTPREHAEAGIKHIRAFMKKHEKKLKAKKVTLS